MGTENYNEKKHLELIKKSYDKAITNYGKKNNPSYDNLPDYIINDPDYSKYKKELDKGQEGSRNTEIKSYLSPRKGMNFIDLGCCLNLKFYGYDKWPSLYYGVDISSETVKLINETISKKNLNVGSIFCGSIHETPFADNFFDIGACVGVLEYYPQDYVEKALLEAQRILKPSALFVLDIPNITSPTGKVMMMIEKYLKRPERFDMSSHEFEIILQKYFEIIKSSEDKLNSMGIMYFLKCKK